MRNSISAWANTERNPSGKMNYTNPTKCFSFLKNYFPCLDPASDKEKGKNTRWLNNPFIREGQFLPKDSILYRRVNIIGKDLKVAQASLELGPILLPAFRDYCHKLSCRASFLTLIALAALLC